MKSKRAFWLALALLPVGIVGVRAGLGRADLPQVQSASTLMFDEEAAAETLAAALRLETVSNYQGPGRLDPFFRLHDLLERRFPLTHRHLTRDKVGEASLLYRWAGTDSSLKPMLILAHQDVVPPTHPHQWTYPPFSGAIVNGFVWGRGAIDDKASVLASMESVERLLEAGYRPKRTLYLAYGHDEEVGGAQGAKRIAQHLKTQGVALELVLDEGLLVGKGLFPGVSRPIAMIGLAEKGIVSVELTTKQEGGHASLPPRHTAVGILSQAISRLEDHPMPARPQWAHRFFETLVPDMPFGQRLVFANLWLTAPVLDWGMSQITTTNALLRTTTAATLFQAGVKENVLPSEARAVVNFRIIPGDQIATVLAHVKRVLNDPQVAIRALPDVQSEPSPVSPPDSAGYRTLETAIRQVFSDAVVAPSLVVGATDARYFADLSKQVYRFLPYELDSADLKRLHGKDERLSIANYANAIRFYRQLILNGCS